MKKHIFISTSIPYVNAAPHVGHAQEFVLADIVARYQRLMGNDVFFLSGTDDNALKNVLKAEEAGEPVAEYVARHAAIFQNLLKELNASNDDFIRTSADERHRKGATKLWQSFKPEDITQKSYTGYYCVGCEEFKTEKDLVHGECPEHPGKKLEEVQEKNYFFKLGNYTDKLIGIIESGELKIYPESRKNEVLAFLRGGLEDLSISRSVERARGWGIKVPGDDSQVMYVWVDALSNYITALGYADDAENYENFWEKADDSIHSIGKGITRFHAIYWPAFLLSAGLPLPKTIFVHGYYTVDGQKMSKTLGNVVDPFEVIKEYGTDAFRYFVSRECSIFEDSDYTNERFATSYNGNLVNGLGNLTARIMKLAEDNLTDVTTPESQPFPKEYIDAVESYDFNGAMDFIWKEVQRVDQKITETAPFKVIKTDPEAGKAIIAELTQDLYWIGRYLQPFLPQTSDIIKDAVKTNKKPENMFPRKG